MHTKNPTHKVAGRLIGIRGFRRLFGLLEILFAIGAILFSILIVALPEISNHAVLELELGEVGLLPEMGALSVQVDDAKGGSIGVTNLRGEVLATNAFDSEGLRSIARWHTLPMVVFFAVFAIVLVDLLRRLCRKVEGGESFSGRSVDLVRKIGLVIIAFTILSAGLTTLLEHSLAGYLAKHATVQGIKMDFTTPHHSSLTLKFGSQHFDFDIGWAGILTGLLVLSLGEVFRQGRELKEENELTV